MANSEGSAASWLLKQKFANTCTCMYLRGDLSVIQQMRI